APLTASGAVRGRIVGSLSRQDAFIDLEQAENSTFYAVVEADLGERTLLSAGISDERDQLKGVYWGGLPYWFSDGTRTDWNRSTTTATNWNRWDTTEQTVFASL